MLISELISATGGDEEAGAEGAVEGGDEGGAELRGEGLEALVVLLEDGRTELVAVGLALADGGLALGNARAGGKLGVTPVGVDATLSGHAWSTPYLLS